MPETQHAASRSDAEIRLGFVEEVDPAYPLDPQTFPNKVGGKPVCATHAHRSPLTAHCSPLTARRCG